MVKIIEQRMGETEGKGEAGAPPRRSGPVGIINISWGVQREFDWGVLEFLLFIFVFLCFSGRSVVRNWFPYVFRCFPFVFIDFMWVPVFPAPTREEGTKTDQKGTQNGPHLLPIRSPKGASFLDEFSDGFWCQKGVQKGPLGRHFGVFWMFFG